MFCNTKKVETKGLQFLSAFAPVFTRFNSIPDRVKKVQM